MFGFYRLTLALLVALSHFGLIVAGFNPGQWAVISFYVLSGLLMDRHCKKLGSTRSFYLDRILRIYPLYFVVCVLSAFFIPMSLGNKLINLTLIPLNYSMFTGVPSFISPAWSLACECQFYMLVPVFVRMSNLGIRALLLGSLLIFCSSMLFSFTAFWAYQGLPGILFVFLSGILINRKDWKALAQAYGFMTILFTLFSIGKFTFPHLPVGININVCVGYILAVPIIACLERLSPNTAWDKICGLFSFPLFLIHTLVQLICIQYLPKLGLSGWVVLSLAASGALVLLVEKPSDHLRYRVRKWK